MARGSFIVRRSHMAGIEAVEAETDHVFPKHTHEQFGIGVIVRGAQKSLSGRGIVDAGPGDLITVNPAEVHDGLPIGEEGRAWNMLYLDPTVVADIAADIFGDNRDYEFRYPVLSDPTAARRFRALYSMATQIACCGLLQTECLLAELVHRLITEKISQTAACPAALRLAKSRMDDAPWEDLTLSDLASASRLSRFQVLRGLTKLTGLTPHAYLMQKRVDLARRLIRSGTALADVAASSGFADQSHMTRAFAGKYGITPGAYAAAIS